MNSRVVQRGKMKASLSVDAMALVMEVKSHHFRFHDKAAAAFIMWLCWIWRSGSCQPFTTNPRWLSGPCGT
jgi:hypothetical protein